MELEPITYCKRKPLSLHVLLPDLRPTCFEMQAYATLFKLAWLVTYWYAPTVDFLLTEDGFKVGITDYIASKGTDTHVLVIDGADRRRYAAVRSSSVRFLLARSISAAPMLLADPGPVWPWAVGGRA